MLVPIFWKRIRVRDAASAALVWPRSTSRSAPPASCPGAIPNVVAAIRFNGPLFRALIPWHAAGSRRGRGPGRARRRGVDAVDTTRRRSGGVGVADGRVARGRPGLLPVVPFYLTPFLFTRAALPLIVWTYSVLPAYIGGTSRSKVTGGSSPLRSCGSVRRSANGANGVKGAKVRKGVSGAGGAHP